MALLPPFMLDAVVAIGIENENNHKKAWIGTGFLYGLLYSGEGENRRYRLWLITNKHVLKDLRRIVIKFNSLEEEGSQDYPIELYDQEGNPTWFNHPNDNIDVAAIFINASVLDSEKRKYNFFKSDEHTARRSRLKELSITEGDRIFILGFPMGIVSELRQYTFCRSGIFSRVRDFIEGGSDHFILDALVFPGNSGGPVILCPSALAIHGTQIIPKADLVGIVKSYIPYQDAAISQQTGRPRIIFEENSGLTSAESADSIHEVAELAENALKVKMEQLKIKSKDHEG